MGEDMRSEGERRTDGNAEADRGVGVKRGGDRGQGLSALRPSLNQIRDEHARRNAQPNTNQEG